MNINESKSRIENEIQNGRLLLDEQLVADLGIDATLITSLSPRGESEGQLLINDVELTATRRKLTINGTTALFDHPQPVATQVEFTTRTGKITFSLPETWRFGHLAPMLSDTTFDKLFLSTPTLIASSVSTQKLHQGLNFTAQISPVSIIPALTLFVDSEDALPISGTISLGEVSPVIELSAPFSKDVRLDLAGINRIALGDAALVMIYDQFEGDEQPSAEVYLQGNWTIGQQTLPIALDMPNENGIWHLTLWPKDAEPLIDLASIVTQLGGSNVLDFLPSEIAHLATVGLNDLAIGFTLSEEKETSVSLSLVSPASIDIIPDQIALSNFLLNLHVGRSDLSSLLGFDGSLHGTVEISGTPIWLSTQIGPDDWLFEANLEAIDLPDISELAQFVSDTDLTTILPPELEIVNALTLTQVRLGVDLHQKSLSRASIGLGIGQAWQIVSDIFAVNGLEASFEVVHPFDKRSRQLSGMVSGVLTLGNSRAVVVAQFPDQPSISTQFDSVSLSELANQLLTEIDLPVELPDITLSPIDLSIELDSREFSLTAESTSTWEFPVGFDGLRVQNVGVSVNRQAAADGKKRIEGHIGGQVAIGTVTFDIAYNFPGDFVLQGEIPSIGLSPLLQEFCGGDVMRSVPIPVSLLEIELTDVDFTIAPGQKLLSFAASTPLGQAEIIIKRTSDGSWGFSLGIAPPETWRFSEIDPVLVVLDPLKFSNTALIVASSEDRSFALTTVDTASTGTSIRRGLNFFASLDMRGIGVDELLGIEALTVYAAIGSSPKNLVIEAQIAGQFQLADNVAFGNIKFRLQPSPTDFAITLLGTVITTIDDSPLRFTGGLGIRAIVTPPSFQARLQATMLGRWNNPMGVDGLAVADVALDLAIGFPPLRPSIGLAGTLQVGDFQGSAAVKIDTINPSQSMLAVSFNRLYLMDVIQTFTPPAVHQSIPQSIAQTVLDVGFEDVDIYIVPQPTSIGELFFEQGISLNGTMSIWGLRAFGYLSIDQTSGVLVEADVDEINIGGLFKLSGAGGRESAYLYLDLRVGGRPSIDISAAIELLGLRREVQLSISDEGFYFQMSGAIFNLFEASLEVRGGSLDNGDGIFVKASMRNDLFAYLREEAIKAIQAAADGAVVEIEEAQRTLSDAQREIQRINGSIDSMRRTVERERARDIKRLQDAQQAVSSAQVEVQRLDREIQHMRQIIQQERNRDIARIRSARDEVQRAQNKVNGLDRQIQSMRQTIRNERASSERNMRNARREVQKAQDTVNTLQGEINSTKRAISRIDDQIRAKKRWLDGKKWWDKTWAGPEYAAYEAAKRIEQGALYTKIGGIEAAKHTAVGALEVAKQVLRGIEAGAKSFPIDADPRVAGLFAARETANLALEAAKQVLHGIEAGAKTFPIDADPRVAGLFAARESANVALEAAKQVVHGIELAAVNVPVDADPRIAALFAARETANAALEVAKLGLEGVKQSVGGLAEVGQYIVDFGLGGLLDIREASFEGSLTATNGGRVKMAMTLSFMGGPHTLVLPFSFHDPLTGAKALVDSLLPS